MPARTLADWLEYIERQHPKSIAMGLERVREVAARMGLRKPAKRSIVVAGTNGKGSTVAFVEAIARARGLRVTFGLEIGPGACWASAGSYVYRSKRPQAPGARRQRPSRTI